MKERYDTFVRDAERNFPRPQPAGGERPQQIEIIPDTGEKLEPFKDRYITRLITSQDGKMRLALQRATLTPHPDIPGWILTTQGQQIDLKEGETQTLFLGDPEADAVRPATPRGAEFLLTP